MQIIGVQVFEDHFTGGFRKHATKLSILSLLVVAKGGEQLLHPVGADGGEAQAGEIGLQPLCQAFRGYPLGFGELCRKDDSNCDGFSVTYVVAFFSSGVFYRVGEAVAKVKLDAGAFFEGVFPHDSGLYGGGFQHEGQQGRWHLRRLSDDGGIGGGIGQEKGFCDFGEAAFPFPWGQCPEHFGADENLLRLDYGSEHILVSVQVHSVFSADGGIGHRKDGGRDESAADAPLVDIGRETGDVGDGSAAEGQQKGVPACSGFHQLTAEGRNGFEVFPLLRCFQADGSAHGQRLDDFSGCRAQFVVIDQEKLAFTAQEGGDIGQMIHAQDAAALFATYEDALFHRMQR